LSDGSITQEAEMHRTHSAATFLAWSAACAAWFFVAGVTLFVLPPLGLVAFVAPFVVATARHREIGFAGAITGLGTTFVLVAVRAPQLHRLGLAGAIGVADGIVLFAADQLRQARKARAR
jgi:hypothetical protein